MYKSQTPFYQLETIHYQKRKMIKMKTLDSKDRDAEEEEVLFVAHIWSEKELAMLDLSSVVGTGIGVALFSIAYAVYAAEYKRSLKHQQYWRQEIKSWYQCTER